MKNLLIIIVFFLSQIINAQVTIQEYRGVTGTSTDTVIIGSPVYNVTIRFEETFNDTLTYWTEPNPVESRKGKIVGNQIVNLKFGSPVSKIYLRANGNNKKRVVTAVLSGAYEVTNVKTEINLDSLKLGTAYCLFNGKDSVRFGVTAAGDSVSNFNPNFKYKYVYFSYQDTGSTAALGGLSDTLYAYSYNSDLAVWDVVGCIEVNTGNVVSPIVPGSGNKRMYLVNIARPYQVQIILGNTGGGWIAGRKGYISWSGRND